MSLCPELYSCIASLEEIQLGRLDRAPLHLKLLPLFTINKPADKLIQAFEEMNPPGQFEITGGPMDYYSNKHDHLVRVIHPRHELKLLHEAITDSLALAGILFVHPEYAGLGYRPHITPQGKERKLNLGQIHRYREIQLLRRSGDDLIVLSKKKLGDNSRLSHSA